nr:hypothetical protein [Tanacetum cinerariifolium]
MFHKKNINYVYLLWEDLLFQIENKDAKKTNKMSYPRFRKIIIDYFMSKDLSISRRNEMFWHTARDDTMYTSMRYISRHEKTLVYGTILLKELTYQAMLGSKAYQTYYTFASREKAPKPNDDNGGSEDHDDDSDDKRTESNSDEIPDLNKSNEEHDEEEEYDDEFNLGFKQEEEDSHVTLTPVLDTQKTGGLTQSSSISSDFTTTTVPLPPPFFNPLQQEATPTPTPTTFESKTSFTSLLDFAFVFKFNERVTNMEKDLSEIKQVDQYAQAFSSIPAIVDHVATPVIEKNVTESLEAYVLTRSSSQPQSLYEAAVTLFEFELTKILIDKMEKNKSFDVADYKRDLYDALVKSYNTDKDIFESYGEVFSDLKSKEKKSSSTSIDASQSQHKSFGKYAHAEEPNHTVEDSGMQQDQEFVTGDNDEQPTDKEVTKADYQVERAEEPPTSFDELNDTSFDFSVFVMNRLKIPNLTQAILVGSAFNLLKDPHGIIYVDQYRRKRLMRADELYKFSDGTLNDVRSALYDNSAGIRMEYLPIRK